MFPTYQSPDRNPTDRANTSVYILQHIRHCQLADQTGELISLHIRHVLDTIQVISMSSGWLTCSQLIDRRATRPGKADRIARLVKVRWVGSPSWQLSWLQAVHIKHQLIYCCHRFHCRLYCVLNRNTGEKPMSFKNLGCITIFALYSYKQYFELLHLFWLANKRVECDCWTSS